MAPAVWGTVGAGESAESLLPPTWMVIFLDVDGCSVADCWTLSLILGCEGSGTTALAFLISSAKNSCNRVRS